MIQQPELGIKIANQRKTKGLTQQDLVNTCNINVRTLQRIEAGEVTPRPHTVKLIFKALDIEFNNYSIPVRKKDLFLRWFKKNRARFIDLFNLKTNTMKKVTILSLTAFVLFFAASTLVNQTFAQSEKKVRNIIKDHNSNFVNWFNNANAESIAGLYKQDACIIGLGCGINFIKDYYNQTFEKYKVVEITTTHISLKAPVAVEKGTWKVQLNTGEIILGEYLTEWELVNKKWLIANESSEVSQTKNN